MEHYDTLDTEILEYISTMDTLVLAYQKMLPTLKVRTVNVLLRWQNNFPNIEQFILYLIQASYQDIAKQDKCGRITIDEIQSLQKSLTNIPGISTLMESPNTPDQDIQIKKHKLPDNIDDLIPIVKESITKLSSRSQNRITSLLKECNNSLFSFYERICDPHCIDSIPTVGRKSTPEILDFFANTRRFLEQFPDEASVYANAKHLLIATLGLPSEAIKTIYEQEKSLGYFPLFAAIQIYLNNLPPNEKAIINGSLYIYNGQELCDRNELAATLHLSAERVRQKRISIILKDFPYYFKPILR